MEQPTHLHFGKHGTKCIMIVQKMLVNTRSGISLYLFSISLFKIDFIRGMLLTIGINGDVGKNVGWNGRNCCPDGGGSCKKKIEV